MCGLKKLSSGVFPESWKVLAERRRRRLRRRRRKRTQKKSPSYPGWLNKSTFRTCNTPGRPRMVYKNDVESCFEEFWDEIAKLLQSWGQWPPFSIPAERIIKCIIGSKLVILAQIPLQVKMAKMTSRSMIRIFDTNREHPRMHMWCKCGDSSPNLWRVTVRTSRIPRILSEMAKMTLKVKVSDPHFQYQPRPFQDVYLVQIWWIQPKSVTSYCADKPNFLEFWVKMAKMTLKVKINDHHFQYQDAWLVQIWWFKLKSVTSYRADKVKFTHRQTDGRTVAGDGNTSSVWKVWG